VPEADEARSAAFRSDAPRGRRVGSPGGSEQPEQCCKDRCQRSGEYGTERPRQGTDQGGSFGDSQERATAWTR
jgi:hypothetical protein